MSRKNPPPRPKPPEKEAHSEIAPFDHQRRERGVPAPLPKAPSLPDLDGKYDRLTRELVLISVLFLGLIGLSWAVLSGRHSDNQEPQAPTTNWLRVAQTHLNEDRLTQPSDDNALEAFLQAQQRALGSSAVESGLQAISERYLEMIQNLIVAWDFPLALETLNAAELVIPHAPSGYAEALAQAREQLNRLALQHTENRQLRGPTAANLQPLSVFQDPLTDRALGPKMVVIPEGNFVLGSPETEPDRDADEGPLYSVSIGRFAMAQTETTFADYQIFTQAVGWALPDDFNWGRDQRPVINVTWLEARAYANWLSEQTGFRYRLPTEAEWEYAARAGTTTPFISGDCLTPEYANVDFRAKSEQCPRIPVNIAKTVPVGESQPNPWGLYNMYGNVREWVQDCWQMSYHPTVTDGSAYYSSEGGSCGQSGKRALRGGAWHSPPIGARTANRYAMPEHEWANSVGFRLVRELD